MSAPSQVTRIEQRSFPFYGVNIYPDKLKKEFQGLTITSPAKLDHEQVAKVVRIAYAHVKYSNGISSGGPTIGWAELRGAQISYTILAGFNGKGHIRFPNASPPTCGGYPLDELPNS